MIMNSVTIALIAFACVAGGAMIGLFLNAVLPSQHLSGDAKDTVKLGMGLIGTMTAILLGLLIASAKETRDLLRGAVSRVLEAVWPQGHPENSGAAASPGEPRFSTKKFKDYRPRAKLNA
jgi:hypothetical protein